MGTKLKVITMNKIILILITASMLFTKGYAQQAEVLTLGVFHFEFPNLDVQQISEEDQIDVLSPQYQKEIELISKKLAQFKPDAIVIEWPLYKQSEIDSLYNSYLTGKHELNRNEIQQLGFRIARMCNAKIYCADAWGAHTTHIEKLLDDDESNEYLAFEESFSNSPDSALYYEDEPIFKQQGILAQLIHLNDPVHIKYESVKGDYTGTDFESGRWFNRNLRILRNIQRIPDTAGKRILVIFGAAHMNILNYLFECSPEYKLLNINDYLK